MATVALIDAEQAPLLARPYYANGDPGPIVTSLAQVPELLEVAIPFIGTVLGPSAISWRAKELVIVRTSALLECRYCLLTHTAVALDAGLTPDETRTLRGREAWGVVGRGAKPHAGGETLTVNTTFDDPREVALLNWVDAVACGRGAIAEPTRKALHAHWDDHEVVELTLLVGATMMLNRYATALELPVAEDTLNRLTDEDLL